MPLVTLGVVAAHFVGLHLGAHHSLPRVALPRILHRNYLRLKYNEFGCLAFKLGSRLAHRFRLLNFNGESQVSLHLQHRFSQLHNIFQTNYS
jgi:hypothetical protein